MGDSHKNEPPVSSCPGGSSHLTFDPEEALGLLTIAFLDFFELGIQHVILGLFRVPARPTSIAAAAAAGARRRLLVHCLQQRGRCLLESLGLAVDPLPVVA